MVKQPESPKKRGKRGKHGSEAAKTARDRAHALARKNPTLLFSLQERFPADHHVAFDDEGENITHLRLLLIIRQFHNTY